MNTEEERRQRIIRMIEEENISQASFARMAGLNTSTLSHVVTGRNNPSDDVMEKILAAFPKYSRDWLYDGIGEMLLPHPTEQLEPHHSTGRGLFIDYNDNVRPKEAVGITSSNVNPIELSPTLPPLKVEEKIVKIGVKKIILYYDDNTFQTFVPEEQSRSK